MPTYEIVIKDQTGGISQRDNPGVPSNKQNNEYTPRPKVHKQNMATTIKGLVRNYLYNNTKEKALAEGKDLTDASKKAAHTARNAMGAVAIVSHTVSGVIRATASNVGTFTSNQQYQNTVDNITGLMGEGLGALSMIGAGAVAGGPAGAAIAAVGVVANKAIQIGSTALNLAKKTKEEQVTSQRASERLGYQSYGRSR